MVKLAIAADVLSKFLLYALPVLAGLHALVLIAYAGLVRNWQSIKPLLPRNGIIFVVLLVSAGLMFPLHARAERWRYAGAFALAHSIETQLENGRYLAALRARAAMTVASPARQALDLRIAEAAPRVLTESITLANRGDYIAANQLAELAPQTGPTAKKRARLMVLWQPYAARQKQREASNVLMEEQRFAHTLESPLASYDRLAKETLPKALQLDPTSTTRIDGKPVHPLATMLIAAGVRAKEIENLASALGAPSAHEAALKMELVGAASAFKRGCVETLSFANTNDALPAERAKQAFSEASAHRAKIERWRVTLLPLPVAGALSGTGNGTGNDAGNGTEEGAGDDPRGTLVPSERVRTEEVTPNSPGPSGSPLPESDAHAPETFPSRPAAGFFPTFPPFNPRPRRSTPSR